MPVMVVSQYDMGLLNKYVRGTIMGEIMSPFTDYVCKAIKLFTAQQTYILCKLVDCRSTVEPSLTDPSTETIPKFSTVLPFTSILKQPLNGK